MRRERNSEAVRERVHRRAPGRDDPVLGNPIAGGLRADLGVLGVEEHVALGVEQVPFIGHGCRAVDAVGVVENEPG